jgi:hypothetical protein
MLAVLVALKPPFALLGMPFVLARRWPVVLAGTVAALVLVGVFAASGTIHDWKDYSAAMRQWADKDLDQGAGPPSAEQPAVIEGMGTLRSRRAFAVEDISVRGLTAALTGAQLSARVCLMIGLVLVLAVLGAFAGQWRSLSDIDLLLLGFVACILATISLPAPRFSYQLVLWLGPLLVVVRDRRRYPAGAVIALLVGALSGLRVFGWVPHSYAVGECVMLAAMLSALARVKAPHGTPEIGLAASGGSATRTANWRSTLADRPKEPAD